LESRLLWRYIAVRGHLFSEVLSQFVERAGYTTGQLARLSGIPKSTITNWLQGRVSKPRVRNDLLELAVVLHLTVAETSRLLQAACHPPLPQLLVSPDNQRHEGYLSPWFEALQHRPFQIKVDPPNENGREKESYALGMLLQGNRQQAIHSLQLFHLLSLAALLIIAQPQTVRAGWVVYLLESIEAEAGKVSSLEVGHLLDDVLNALSSRIERGKW
jgi:transcriptional regulator with XRE-family HTH domain